MLAALAATLDTTGALVFGIPYAIVIFFSSFLLSLIPVIGPVVLPFPPMIIALIFTPLPRPLFYLPWLLVGEQIATNVIGPRVQGRSVGIHPLEATAAALVGFPIAGFIGAFFAVPVVSFLHVVVCERRYVAHDMRAPRWRRRYREHSVLRWGQALPAAAPRARLPINNYNHRGYNHAAIGTAVAISMAVVRATCC